MRKLWDEIQEVNACKEEQGKAPLIELDLDKPQANLEIQSRYNMAEPFDTSSSKASSMKELPSFLGNYADSVDDVKKISLQYKPSASVIDMATLHALLSAKVKVTMTLAEVLKRRPKLWLEVVKSLKKMGIHLPLADAIKKVVKETKPNVRCEPVPLNKVGDYSEGNNSNTTLPVEYNDIQSLAILDSGAGVALITIQVWEAWGKRALRKTQIKLQLADGFMERPLGLLEKVVVTSYGIKYGNFLWN